ncbi:MAG: hypothetical protein KBA26_12155 [Candidatus Delongbacteria bacterium]|nr:hypothetical protein [Candidatus Delongbacteria bacterium]
MIRILSVFFVWLSLTLITCCLSGENKIIHAPTQSEMGWQIYHLSDTLTFIGLDQSIRRFMVKEIHGDTLAQSDKFRTGCDVHYLTRIEVGFTELPDACPTCAPAHQLTISKDRSGLYVQLCWMYLTGYSMQDKATDTLTVGGELYQDVFWVTTDTTQTQPAVWRWAYSRSRGMLRFDSMQGQHWTRVLP